jgi:hypothetical protein
VKSAPSLTSLWLAIGLGSLVCLSIIFAGSVLTLGNKFGAIHPLLEIGFYLVVASLIFLLLVRPIFSVLFSPVIALEQFADKNAEVAYRTCRRMAGRLIDGGNLKKEQIAALAGALRFGRNLRDPLREIIQARKDSCIEIIREQATVAFLATAISQSGRLDTVALLMINARMVKSVVDHFGYRPPTLHLVRIYGNIFAAALLVDSLEDLDLTTFTTHHGLAGVISGIPGLQVLSTSLLQGAVSALFTLRVGIITRNCLLSAGRPFVRTEARKAASREALTHLFPVCRAAATKLPGALAQLADKLFPSDAENQQKAGSGTADNEGAQSKA